MTRVPGGLTLEDELAHRKRQSEQNSLRAHWKLDEESAQRRDSLAGVLVQAARRHGDEGRAPRSNRRVARTASSRGDPLHLLWDALEAHGCESHGANYAFRSRCPAHDGDDGTSLSVRIGADGRALVYCHAHGCEADAIAAALGLQIADLFPDGHHRGQRYPLRPLVRSDFDGTARTLVNVLAALEAIDEPWRVLLTSTCPYCGSPGAWLRASRDRSIPTYSAAFGATFAAPVSPARSGLPRRSTWR